MTENNQLPSCPIDVVLTLISNKWKILIIRDLLEGTKRFGELKKSTGASQKTLTTNLRELEQDELLTRKVLPQIPPRVDYALTDLGVTLSPIIDTIAEWGSDYKKYCALKNKRTT